MSDLAGARAVALEQLTAEDDACADAAANADDDQVVRPRIGAERALGNGSRLRVVGNHDGNAEVLCDHAAQGQVRPVEIDRPAHDAGARVDQARRADADAQNRVVAVAPDETVDQAVDDLNCLRAVAALEIDLGRLDHDPAQVNQRAAEHRCAQIEPDRVAAVRTQAKHDRRLATGRLAAAAFLDQPVVDEVADEC